MNFFTRKPKLGEGTYRESAKPDEPNLLAALCGTFEVELRSLEPDYASLRQGRKDGGSDLTLLHYGFGKLATRDKGVVGSAMGSTAKLRVTIEVIE